MISYRSAVVIGGGFGGMAAALRLRARGYSVTLFERGRQLGGRASVFEREGFLYDGGPTVITAPFLFEELFALFGASLSDHVQLVPLNPWYRFVFHTGETFDYGGSLEETLSEIERISPSDREGYLALLQESRELFELGFNQLSQQPFDRLSSLILQVPHLIRLKSHRSTWDLVSGHLQHDLLRRALSIQPLLVGGNPFSTTCLYGLIHYLERAFGVHFVMGGTGALVLALETLMRRVSIDIRFETTVEEIVFSGRRATGIRTQEGEVIPASLVVSNADPAHLFSTMIPSGKQSLGTRIKTRYGHYSMGLFVLYFGTRKVYPDVAHHTIWLGDRYRELLGDLFERGVLAEDFSLYVHRPTATDPSFAPKGCDSFYVLCPVPNLKSSIDWTLEGPRLRDRMVKALDGSLLPGLSEVITADFFRTPEDFKADYLSHLGAGFSLAPDFTQSAWFRFNNHPEGFDNLYLVGGGTHPGAGLPGVLASAKVLEHYLETPHVS